MKSSSSTSGGLTKRKRGMATASEQTYLDRRRTLLFEFEPATLARLARPAPQFDQRLDRSRLRRRKTRQTRRHRFEWSPITQTQRRLRPQAQHLLRCRLGPLAFAQGLELRKALVAEEIDVRAVAACIQHTLPTAQRLAP